MRHSHVSEVGMEEEYATNSQSKRDRKRASRYERHGTAAAAHRTEVDFVANREHENNNGNL